MADLILASSSPRRKELLQQVGLSFRTFSPDIDESVLHGESPDQYVLRLAENKASVVSHQFPDAIIIAADTTLSVDGKIIGKPESKAHAFEIWQSLSGRSHEVYTGVCVVAQQQVKSTVVITRVEFQTLSLNDMEQYWASGEPVGKAGGYAIQGIAAKFIPKIEGSYSNVVGLPLHETLQLLQQITSQG